jgi:hypothetical protein
MRQEDISCLLLQGMLLFVVELVECTKIKKVVHSEMLCRIAIHRKTGLIATYISVLNGMSRE